MTDAHEVQDHRETLYVTEAELIRRIGAPRDKMRALLDSLDRNSLSGFPKKNPLFGGRRHWPSVKAFFDRMEANKMALSQPRGESRER